jgi:shikimate kinase
MDAANSADHRIRRVVLLGFMCAGKSTVGERLAAQLGWEHLDLDTEIEHREGRRIAEIFRTDGEAYFRALEAKLTLELANRWNVVLSPGGGWITNAGLLEALQPATVTVWLQVSPREVLARLGARADERPLLDTPDPLGTIKQMLADREPLYQRADLVVPTGCRGVQAVVADIQDFLRGRTTS